jgi:DNA topoisomerase VI subunit A
MRTGKRKDPAPSRTLFDPDPQGHGGAFSELPYYWALKSCADDPDEKRFGGCERWAFGQVVEHEVSLYEPRGYIVGPLTWKIGKSRASDLSRSGTPTQIPAFVEHDALAFKKCTACGILLLENYAVFKQLVERGAWNALNMVLATGSGIPRVAIRRLLHRLSGELKLPVYLLTDNDTWGYFIFSLVKRGLLGPHAFSEYMGVANLRFLGMRAGDVDLLTAKSLLRPWKPEWDLRLKNIGKYSCFQTAAWKSELDDFKGQQGAVDLTAFYESLGPERFLSEYLEPKIRLRQWLR